MTKEEVVALAETQVRLLRERIAVFEAIAEQAPEHARKRRMAPLDLGLRLVKASYAFWLDVARDPPVP